MLGHREAWAVVGCICCYAGVLIRSGGVPWMDHRNRTRDSLVGERETEGTEKVVEKVPTLDVTFYSEWRLN